MYIGFLYLHLHLRQLSVALSVPIYHPGVCVCVCVCVCVWQGVVSMLAKVHIQNHGTVVQFEIILIMYSNLKIAFHQWGQHKINHNTLVFVHTS